MAYGIGPVSGCHINPAVTVAMLVAGRMPTNEAIGYIVSQLVGGAPPSPRARTQRRRARRNR